MGTLKQLGILTQEQLALIGQVAFNSAQLELTVAGQVELILRLSELEREAILPYGLAAKLELLRIVGLQRIRSKKRKVEFEKLIGRWKALASQRNDVIHGAWGPEGAKASFHFFQWILGKAAKPNYGSVTATNKKRKFPHSKLEQLAEDLDLAGTEIWRFAKLTYLKPRLLYGRVDALRRAGKQNWKALSEVMREGTVNS